MNIWYTTQRGLDTQVENHHSSMFSSPAQNTCRSLELSVHKLWLTAYFKRDQRDGSVDVSALPCKSLDLGSIPEIEENHLPNIVLWPSLLWLSNNHFRGKYIQWIVLLNKIFFLQYIHTLSHSSKFSPYLLGRRHHHPHFLGEENAPQDYSYVLRVTQTENHAAWLGTCLEFQYSGEEAGRKTARSRPRWSTQRILPPIK